jgi:hypothetical protein
MLRRRRIIARGNTPHPVVEEPEDEEEVEEEESVVKKISKVVTDDEDEIPEVFRRTKASKEDDIVAHDEEDEEEEMKPPSRKSKIVVDDEDDEEPVVKKPKKVVEEDEDEEEEEIPVRKSKIVPDDEEEEEDPKSIVRQVAKDLKKGRQVPTRASARVLEIEPDPETIVEKQTATLLKKTGISPIVDILEMMETGKTLVITKEADNTWIVNISTQGGVISKLASYNRLSGRQYYEEVTSEEYLQWSKEWKQLTYSEKKSKAIKMGVTWNKHPNPKVDVMRITDAVRQHSGIEKYKPEYATRLSRSRIRS